MRATGRRPSPGFAGSSPRTRGSPRRAARCGPCSASRSRGASRPRPGRRATRSSRPPSRPRPRAASPPPGSCRPSPSPRPPTPGAPAPAAREPRRRAWLWAGAALLGVAAVAAARAAPGERGRPRPPRCACSVRSQPMGASVLVDGRDTGVVTNGELVVPAPVPEQVVLTFRKAGHRDETRSVRLPLPAGEAVSVTLQAAASLVPVRTAAARRGGDPRRRARGGRDPSRRGPRPEGRAPHRRLARGPRLAGGPRGEGRSRRQRSTSSSRSWRRRAP